MDRRAQQETGAIMSALEAETVLYHDTCHHALYRLTCEEFDALRDRSRGCCEICRLRVTDSTFIYWRHKGGPSARSLGPMTRVTSE